jgi:hypothetical protein
MYQVGVTFPKVWPYLGQNKNTEVASTVERQSWLGVIGAVVVGRIEGESWPGGDFGLSLRGWVLYLLRQKNAGHVPGAATLRLACTYLALSPKLLVGECN